MKKEYLTFEAPDPSTAHATLAEMNHEGFQGLVQGRTINVRADHLTQEERRAVHEKVAMLLQKQEAVSS